MNPRACILAVYLCVLASLCPARAAETLPDKISAIISSPEYKQARWGILAIDGRSGAIIYEHNADQLFLPASTAKLYSCAAVLDALGANHTFNTPVYRRGPVVDGRLQGDLIILAQGDPTMGGRNDAHGHMAFTNHDHTYANFMPDTEWTETDPLAGFKSLAQQIAAAGVRWVGGDVLVDDRLFTPFHCTGSGPDWVTSLMVNDNVIDFLVTPALKPGRPARLQFRPEIPFLQVENHVETTVETTEPEIEYQRQNGRVTIRGHVSCKSVSVHRIYPMEDPSAFARALFIEVLRHHGIGVAAKGLDLPRGKLPPKEDYAQLPCIAHFTSPPLGEVVKVTLKVSHNLYANTLPLLIAARHGQANLSDGIKLQGRFLADLGIGLPTIALADGAGGSSADAVTPRATVQLLQALARRPDAAILFEGLPILGIDGTLADAVPGDSPVRGKVRAKSGTLVWKDFLNDRQIVRSKALAGTMTLADGRPVLFAMFVNDVLLPSGVTWTREGKTLGRLCEILYRHTPQ